MMVGRVAATMSSTQERFREVARMVREYGLQKLQWETELGTNKRDQDAAKAKVEQTKVCGALLFAHPRLSQD